MTSSIISTTSCCVNRICHCITTRVYVRLLIRMYVTYSITYVFQLRQIRTTVSVYFVAMYYFVVSSSRNFAWWPSRRKGQKKNTRIPADDVRRSTLQFVCSLIINHHQTTMRLTWRARVVRFTIVTHISHASDTNVALSSVESIVLRHEKNGPVGKCLLVEIKNQRFFLSWLGGGLKCLILRIKREKKKSCVFVHAAKSKWQWSRRVEISFSAEW